MHKSMNINMLQTCPPAIPYPCKSRLKWRESFDVYTSASLNLRIFLATIIRTG